jgi:hypothetical protein
VFASVLMGALFAVQRRATGGVQAPAITHLVWTVLMMRFLPPLFAEEPIRPLPVPAPARDRSPAGS